MKYLLDMHILLWALGEDAGEYGVDKPECDKPLDKKWMCGNGGRTIR